MTTHAWRLAARLLEAKDREAIEGDLMESASGPWQALRDVLGLVLRRQALLWKNWRPWLAAFGLALPGALLLMGLSLSVSTGCQLYAWIIGNYAYFDPKLLHDTGLTPGPGVWSLICQVLLLIGVSWSAGFVVSSLSRRTLWISAALCLSPCAFCFARFRHQPVSPFCLFLFLLPALWGARQGLQVHRINLPFAFVLAAAVTVLCIPAYSPRWLYNCTLCWPAWYLAATSFRAATVRDERNETFPSPLQP